MLLVLQDLTILRFLLWVDQRGQPSSHSSSTNRSGVESLLQGPDTQCETPETMSSTHSSPCLLIHGLRHLLLVDRVSELLLSARRFLLLPARTLATSSFVAVV